ncbi:MAG: hypothetical protein O3B75_02490 [Planctomycetota bacterium]|nr:hypothetical protein [Planctomycetota bacterium]
MISFKRIVGWLWSSFLILCVLIGISVSIAWMIGRVLTDRFAVIQSLHWIPTIIALAITLLCATILIWSSWKRCRRLLWMIAFFQAVVFLLQDYAITRTTPLSIAESDSAIRIVHVNVNWPGDNAKAIARKLSSSLLNLYGQTGPDVLFLSEYGQMLGTEVVDMYCPKDATAVSIGRFAVVSRLQIIEVIPLYDDTKSTAAFVRFASWKGNASWGALLIDVPSNPAIYRFKMLSDLRLRLDALKAPVADIVVGDFNTVRGGEAIETFAPKMRDAFAESGIGYGATYPRVLPLWHIDQMLLGPRVTAKSYEVIDTGVGKHCMQIATIQVKTQPN